LSSDPKVPGDSVEERPDPKDLGEEIDNALHIVGGVLKGEIAPGDIFDRVLQKFFPERPKPEEKKDAKPTHLRAVDGGHR
jgi:hypothetical protein